MRRPSVGIAARCSLKSPMTRWTASGAYSAEMVEAASRRNSSLMSKGTYLLRVPRSRRALRRTRVFSQDPAPSSTNVSALDSSAIVAAWVSNSRRSARVG